MRIDAHSLKSNARDFGALQLTDLCQELEAKCREGVPFDATALIDSIAQEETAVRAALERVKASDFAGD